MWRLVLVVVMFFSLIVLTSCDSYKTDYGKSSAVDGIKYTLFYIEGMPCMAIGDHREYGGNHVPDGVTCDWSKWKGR